MKKLITLLPLAAVIIITACNTSTADGELLATDEEKKSCEATCAAKADESGFFDSALSSVCQASCGVSDYDEGDVVEIAEATVGDITKCPVSGAIYKVKENSPTIGHDGVTYHSCCASCAEVFKKDPERFHKNV